jgi:cbb3-type cytochrome oxidase subunit 3
MMASLSMIDLAAIDLTAIDLAAVVIAGAVVCIIAVLAIALWRSRKAASAQEAAVAELTRAQADAAARLEGAIRLMANGQSQLQPRIFRSLVSGSRSSTGRRRISPNSPPR